MSKPKMGRPKLPKGAARGKAFTCLLTPDELRAVKRASKAAGMSASAWARDLIVRATLLEIAPATGA